jgi:hypothetical protein
MPSGRDYTERIGGDESVSTIETQGRNVAYCQVCRCRHARPSQGRRTKTFKGDAMGRVAARMLHPSV